MTDDEILDLADAVLASCRAAGLTVATAESCTGGMIAAALTAIAGSSDVVERGFVTYSNAAKTDMLGVPPDLIAAAGAVSEAVARRMAEGALRAFARRPGGRRHRRRRAGRGKRGQAGGAGVVRPRAARRQNRHSAPRLPGRSRCRPPSHRRPGAAAAAGGGLASCEARPGEEESQRRAAKKHSPITSSTSL